MSYENFYATTLEVQASASDTTLQVKRIPNTITTGWLVLEARNTTNREIVWFNGVSGNILQNVLRGQQGTSGIFHAAGTSVEQNPTASDFQDLYDSFASFSALNAWATLTSTPVSAVAQGNGSYLFTTSGDQRALVNPGTRIRTTRTVAAPTQSTSLNGTTQYWNNTTPNKMTFTDDFVVSAWVKLRSYAGYPGIMSRFNGISGWSFNLETDGRLTLRGYNGAGVNNSAITSYQSVPLNKWVHVTAQLDMSAFTNTPTTSYVMIDGVDVPAAVTRGGTNPTALVQAGNLEVGSVSGGLQPLSGKVTQAFVAPKITQANIRTIMNQGITPTSITMYGIYSAYSFNNSALDLNTTTPNDLTAQGSATATNADSPFGGQASGTISSTIDYHIVMSAPTFTGGNTSWYAQVPEGNTIPTIGGVSALSYSSAKAPYGMPIGVDKWQVLMVALTDLTQAASVSNTWYNIGQHRIIVPVGSWGSHTNATPYRSSGGVIKYTLSTVNNNEHDSNFSAYAENGGSTIGVTLAKSWYINTASPTTYYLNILSTSGTPDLYIFGQRSATQIILNNAYL